MKITKAVVFGVGAAGANSFLHILYAYLGLDMAIVDDDVVEDRNISPGTQPYTKTDLRRPKVQALARIAMQAKNKRVETFKERVTNVARLREIIGDPETTLVIDAFDNSPSRNLFKQLGDNYNVLHIGFSASMTGEAVWNEVWEEMEDTAGDKAIDVCEMGIARPFIFALTALAAIVVNKFVENGVKENMYFDTTLNVKHWS